MQIQMMGLNIKSVVSFPHNTLQIGQGKEEERRKNFILPQQLNNIIVNII